MPSLTTHVDGLTLPNPFVIASGPPGTNLNVITRAFREGWGAVIAKTVSLDASKVVNVTPRYAKLHSTDGKEVIGWENIELISDRPFSTWLDEFRRCKDAHPDGCLIASIMEEYSRDAWVEIVERCQDAGVDGFELNFSCPHGLPERRMGSAMGQDPELLEEVCGWVMDAAKKPVWAKMTPNITHIEEPARASLKAGCQGISAINTLRCVMGVNLETLRPEPTVEGYTTPGGYSSRAIKPIALRMVMELAQMIRAEFPGRSLSGIGGVEDGSDAAQYILLGADTVQVCTGVMKFGYGHVKSLCDGLLAFMERHGFESPADFKGRSLDYFDTHAGLVQRQAARKAAPTKASPTAGASPAMVASDRDWTSEDFIRQSNALAQS
ncbi:MAG: NAD-dependent dihydropyrimidine dehydrogenase subunit PreA [Verrucomicrobiaceae bacterium]|nr:MAG: NAD-dependent dihydropyrimidine dehydrogenase subunit PreA [Verrucomicrobiaceae bacterium]